MPVWTRIPQPRLLRSSLSGPYSPNQRRGSLLSPPRRPPPPPDGADHQRQQGASWGAPNEPRQLRGARARAVENYQENRHRKAGCVEGGHGYIEIRPAAITFLFIWHPCNGQPTGVVHVRSKFHTRDWLNRYATRSQFLRFGRLFRLFNWAMLRLGAPPNRRRTDARWNHKLGRSANQYAAGCVLQRHLRLGADWVN